MTGGVIAPTLLVNVNNNKMRALQEEIFGAVAVVIKFKNEKEAIVMAKDNEFGLGGEFGQKTLIWAIRVANLYRQGPMWINNYNNLIGTCAI